MSPENENNMPLFIANKTHEDDITFIYVRIIPV